MKTQFVHGSNRAYAQKLCPWAVRIVRVNGGFRAFESVADYFAWRNQK